jgi:hypothetical protein
VPSSFLYSLRESVPMQQIGLESGANFSSVTTSHTTRDGYTGGRYFPASFSHFVAGVGHADLTSHRS